MFQKSRHSDTNSVSKHARQPNPTREMHWQAHNDRIDVTANLKSYKL